MPFEPGNQEAKKADRRKSRVITQQLVAALNEAAGEGPTKLRKVVDAIIAKAMAGDVAAFTTIADRVDGKPVQAVAGDPDNPLELIHRIERLIVYPPDQNSGGVPPAS